MNVTITMPQLGLTMTEGAVSAWLKKPGDRIKKDEVIMSVSTDKVDMDVESLTDGTLKEIIIKVGQTVPVGTVLAYVEATPRETSTEDALSSPKAPLCIDKTASNEPVVGESFTEALSSSTARVSRDRTEHILASPRSKRLAGKLGIDLSQVKGSGPKGRIVEADLRIMPRQTVDKNIKRRQLIAERMVESITTIPAFSVSVEVNAENMVALYENLKGPIESATGVRLTYTDLLLKAVAISLAKIPDINTLWEGGALSCLPEISLGLAVATDRGIAAPTLTAVDQLSLEQLVKRRAESVGKARQNRLTFADLERAAGTLSNLGMYRVDRFQGIIAPGQTFIVAVGRLRKRPWVDASLVVKPTLVLNLTLDHRVADGKTAALFLECIAEAIENPA